MNMTRKLLIASVIFLGVGISTAFGAVEVVTTTPDLGAIVKAVGGNLVKVASIGKGTEDPHFVEPKPSFIMSLSRARLLFRIGLELEIWLKPLLESSRNLSIQQGSPGFVDCSQVIPVKEIPKVRVDPSMGDVHPLGNPHYWLDPENGIRIAELASAKLCEVDPGNAVEYRNNLKSFRTDIESRIPGWKKALEGFKNRKVAIFHSSWVYFADAFGLEIVGHVEPRPGIPPTGRELAALVSTMKGSSCKLILREQYHSDRFANMAAEKAGGKVLVLPASVEGAEGIKTYSDLFDRLTTMLSEALKCQN